jgi:hypothetical protein
MLCAIFVTTACIAIVFVFLDVGPQRLYVGKQNVFLLTWVCCVYSVEGIFSFNKRY